VSVEGIPAKITIQKEWVFTGRVVDITPSHHLIEKEDGTVIEVSNARVLSVEPKHTTVVRSRVNVR